MSEIGMGRWTRWRRRLPRLLLEGVLLLLLVWGLEYFLTLGAAHGELPNIDGKLLDGRPASAPLTRTHGPAMVYIWATWCPYCKLERSSISSIAKDYPVLTVAMQSGSASEVTAYLQKNGLHWPVLNDPEGKVAAQFGISATPASFIIDADDEIFLVTRGYTTELGLRLRLWLAHWF